MALRRPDAVMLQQVTRSLLPALLQRVVSRLRAQIVKPEFLNLLSQVRVVLCCLFPCLYELSAQQLLVHPRSLLADQQRGGGRRDAELRRAAVTGLLPVRQRPRF